MKKLNKNPHDIHDPDDKRTTGYGPALILDVDNGVDFTFKGMDLKGNKGKPSIEPEPHHLSKTEK